MRHLIRNIVGVATLATLAALAFVPGGSAESRLFTAQSDQAGVTIVQAVRNGQVLPVAGQNGASTFFRIDNPSGAVPCANRIQFTASNGRVVDSNVDLCANNFAVLVRVGAAPAGGGSAALPPATSARSVAIAIDDPNASITEAFLSGKSVPITARQGSYVRINVPSSPAGFECQRDLGLALSDGRRIARLVDVCASNYVVVVALSGGPRPPPPPSDFIPPGEQPLPQPPQPQPAPQPQPQPAPQPPQGQPEVVANMEWQFAQSNNRATFRYLTPATGAAEFSASCTAGSGGNASITLLRSTQGLAPGVRIPVQFTAGTFTKTYEAIGSQASQSTGLSYPVLTVALADPLWAALIKESVVFIRFGQDRTYGLSLRGSAQKARQFLAACNVPVVEPVPQPQPPTTQPPPRPGNAVGFRCNDGSFITIAFGGDSAVVTEGGDVPMVLMRVPSQQGGARYVAGFNELVAYAEEVSWSRDGYVRGCRLN